MRTCVGCRATRPQGELLRYGLAAGSVAPAIGARPQLAGRSAYLCPRRACRDRAIKRRAFNRAFSTSLALVSGGPTAADALWTATADLLRREIQLLDRSAENPHANLRRRGLERLLFELSSPPAPSDHRSSANGQGGRPTHG
ncbi:YlxR family protein [Enhygromyxa salina]